jgi:DNA/RNA endonuclease G (NUC1)
MKNILAFLITLYCSTLSAQLRDSLWWTNPYFKIAYSEVLEQPRWVQYRVACPNGVASRKGMEFFKEDGIKTSDNKDYEENVWDKGHMAPAAHFNCTRDMLFETFTYMNCALQHQSLNRGVWKHLESRERELAKENSFVEVTIRVEFDKPAARVATNAAIPKGFYKELKYGAIKECYYFPNVMPTYTNYKDYKCKCR